MITSVRFADPNLTVDLSTARHIPRSGPSRVLQQTITVSRLSDPNARDKLCEVCSQLPFDQENPPFGNYTGPNYFVLGKISELREYVVYRHCVLCSFLVSIVDGRGFQYEDGDLLFSWWPKEGTFRLSLEDPSRHFPNIWLVGGADSSASIKQIQRARLVTGNQINPKRIVDWLNACQELHGKKCQPPTSTKPIQSCATSHFRLIDVLDGCVIEAPNPCRYLTLSYVWGQGTMLRLTTKNSNILSQPGMLQKPDASINIPQTIRDAITLVQRLGERYLWVDSLCLVQDDEEDLSRGIASMNLIYEQALMCIVAGAGSHAHFGLPGVNEDSRVINQRIAEVRPGLCLTAVPDLNESLESSEYGRRAWTLQEQFFSCRAVFFINDRIYYRCRLCEWSEDTFYDLDPSDSSTTPKDDLQNCALNLDRPLEFYDTVIIEYTKRVLTKQEDAQNAIAGLLQILSPLMKSAFLEGLPTALFDLALIFMPHDSSRRRRIGFPSYSWIGWIGKVYSFAHDFSGKENAWLSNQTWIIWYKRSPSGAIDLVWDISADEYYSKVTEDDIRYRQRCPIDWKRRHCLEFSTSQTEPTQHLYFDTEVPRYPLLQFWTLVVHFWILQYTLEGEPIAYVYDCDENFCGTVFLDSTEDFKRLVDLQCQTRRPFEFAILSERWTKGTPRWDYRERPLDFGPQPYPELSNLYHVLLIEWRCGIAERKGMGSIWQKKVQRSLPPGPVWKEIVLG